MFDHFVELGAIQTAVVEGELDRIEEPARWLSEHERLDTLPAETDVFLSRMREVAAELAESADLQSAAIGTGRLAVTCGACHHAYGGPSFSIGAPPPVEVGVDRATRMIRHLWAVDRMMEGLVGPASASWVAGAEVLAGDPMVPAHLEDRIPDWAGVLALAQQVNQLGEQATTTESADDRAWIYGRLLTTCSACHTLVRAQD